MQPKMVEKTMSPEEDDINNALFVLFSSFFVYSFNSSELDISTYLESCRACLCMSLYLSVSFFLLSFALVAE